MGRRRSQAVTLADVARRAGVSVATASKAINARDQVAAATRERVLRAAAELSFSPGGRTPAIGLLTDERGGRFAMPILLGAETAIERLAGERMSVLLCDARGDAGRQRDQLTVLARQVEGFLVLGYDNDLRPSLPRDLPVPVVYAYTESDHDADTSVVADDEGGARLATEHLVAIGRRHIAHLTGPAAYRAARARANGLLAVLGGHGLRPAGGRPRYGEWSQRWGRDAAHELLATAPDTDAIFCGNDQIAAGVAQTLRERGRRIPDDVALVGYDNWTEFAADCRPPLTTVDLNLERLGATAVRHLVAALGGRPSPGVHRQPCDLVVRESTAGTPAARR
ncbi:putative LacI-family transcriptional regulator [Actinoplanes missouriensis 431]|uniref:Putative LacI-family transcriptional regulator n=1 Tax=Actinoplanes missouriensis (strain ATCC 14538 / DSM 43046 / CBS 188.64 / JCM 3121 / NBRC 102363 / NCIMB 12654 / NRRL B-3342 / UNCC 431) TaxID=512565 RepID=I0H866_ACTM4|nr:LacI family DNA-binding transcriptional regulator [Actinoplanes missouriensis]BAL89203.1 putative LacI-family transcriptional regulator [Actinoplanes missouriensis 431]